MTSLLVLDKPLGTPASVKRAYYFAVPDGFEFEKYPLGPKHQEINENAKCMHTTSRDGRNIPVYLFIHLYIFTFYNRELVPGQVYTCYR